MDNNNQNQTASGAYTPKDQIPTQSPPKVVDIASINAVNAAPSGGNFFKKKPIIIGVLSVLVLALTLSAGVFFFRQQGRVTTPPKAEECKDFGFGQVSRSDGFTKSDTAYLRGDAYNNCSTPVKLYLFKFWCPDVLAGSDGAQGFCSQNQSVQEVTVPAGSGGQAGIYQLNLEQKVGNTGTCGPAQVDAMFTPDYNPNDGLPKHAGLAYLEPCVAGGLLCKQICVSPPATDPVAPRERRRLEATLEPADAKIAITWSVTSDGTKPGSLSSTNANPVLWTAPNTLTTSQKWTIKADVKTATGQSATCSVNLAYAVSPQTHRACQNNACATIQGAGTDSCTADSDCVAASHKECVDSACQSVAGAGEDTCSTDTDCAPTTHKECQNEACKTVSGPGQTTCSTDTDCQTVTTTHRECQNNACVAVTGAGSDQCTSDAACQPAATPPPIPESGNIAVTLGAIVLGLGALLTGAFLLF